MDTVAAGSGVTLMQFRDEGRFPLCPKVGFSCEEEAFLPRCLCGRRCTQSTDYLPLGAFVSKHCKNRTTKHNISHHTKTRQISLFFEFTGVEERKFPHFVVLTCVRMSKKRHEVSKMSAGRTIWS